MTFYNTHRIIWLDAFIGRDGECHAFKRKFVTSINPDARYGDPIDCMIVALNENGAPFIFVHDPKEAMKEIVRCHDKRVIFISSGSLGEKVYSRNSFSTYSCLFIFISSVLYNQIILNL